MYVILLKRSINVNLYSGICFILCGVVHRNIHNSKENSWLLPTLLLKRVEQWKMMGEQQNNYLFE